MESPTSPFLNLLRSDMGLIMVTSDRSVVRWTEIIHNVVAGGMFAMVMMMPSQMPLHCQCRALRILLAYLLAPDKPSKPVLLPVLLLAPAQIHVQAWRLTASQNVTAVQQGRTSGDI